MEVDTDGFCSQPGGSCPAQLLQGQSGGRSGKGPPLAKKKKNTKNCRSVMMSATTSFCFIWDRKELIRKTYRGGREAQEGQDIYTHVDLIDVV